MKKMIFLPILALVFACSNPEYDKKVQPYKDMFAEFKQAKYNFPSSYDFFRMKHFDVESIIDTISKVHKDIFLDENIQKIATENISNWLRNKIYVSAPKTKYGAFVLDTTNMLNLENRDDYYLHSRNIKKTQEVYNKIFQTFDAMHTLEIGDKKIYYDFVPTNGKFVKREGIYVIETLGNFSPDYTEDNITHRSQNFCDVYTIDWYIRIGSDDFFDDRLALKIQDTTYYYYNTMFKDRSKSM